jgi:hypothetical protein
MQKHKNYEKKQGNTTHLKVKNPTVADIKDSEEDESSKNSRVIVRMIHKINRDIYKHLMEF